MKHQLRIISTGSETNQGRDVAGGSTYFFLTGYCTAGDWTGEGTVEQISQEFENHVREAMARR